ncbi:MAG TPA: hypothetical protein VGS79_06345, partial [Puia sp.]|nr:hypothetical protein [Puia sp.]
KSADEADQYDEERPRSNSIRTNLKIIENNQESETADFDTFYSDDLDDALQDELDLEEEEKLEEETDTLNQPDIDESGDISKIDLKSYYLQCAEMIISYWDSQVYLKSIDQIKTYYSINIINLPVKNPKNFLGQWGKLALLKRKSQFYKTNSIKVELPDTLIIANPLIEKKQRPISTV